jgi:hypothetical protein
MSKVPRNRRYLRLYRREACERGQVWLTIYPEIILRFTDLLSRQLAELVSRNKVYEDFLRDLQLHVGHRIAVQIEKVLGGVKIPMEYQELFGNAANKI